MILQALYDYYQRKSSDPESGIAPEGFEWKEIPFVIVIDRDGKFIKLDDTRDENNTKGKALRVPRPDERTGSKSYETVYFLWDHLGYVLNESKTDNKKDVEMAENQHNSWLGLIGQLSNMFPNREDILAIKKFYENNQIVSVKSDEQWKNCKAIAGCNFTFRLVYENETVCEKISLYEDYVRKIRKDGENDPKRICLVTGDYDVVALKHYTINLGKDKPKLVSFQKNSGYDSFGNEQGLNAPVSKKAEFAYTTALNHMLRKNSKNKVILGNLTIVFWSSQENELDETLSSLFGLSNDPDRGIGAIQQLYKSVYTGTCVANVENDFFVLGISANKTRLTTKFWHQHKVNDVADRLKQYFEDISLEGEKTRPLISMLRSIALKQEVDKLPPNLIDGMVVSIFNGGVFPRTLLNQTINRIRAEQSLDNDEKETYKKYHIDAMRVSLLKAYLNRKQRIYNNEEKEITVALDTTNTNEGYLLGRLFAVLEKLQERAQSNINATIKDRYYGAASSTPITVFPQLLKLKVHHLAKIDNQGDKVFYEKKIGEIIELLPPSMPSHMNLEDQAKFAIGYYHQRQDFFNNKETENN